MKQLVKKEIIDHLVLLKEVEATLLDEIIAMSVNCINALRGGNKILLFGNGGSAADAQHIAAEFTGRFRVERKGLAAIALTTDTSALTAIGNDYGYEKIFSRQVDAVATEGDVVIGISTSGNSLNIIEGIITAKEKKCITIGLLGRDGGKLKEMLDIPIVIPSNDTARIQEMHIMIGHILCHLTDGSLKK